MKKSLTHSPRGLEVLDNLHAYVIRTLVNNGPDVIKREVKLRDPGQCLAALVASRKSNVRCLVYAVGTAYGEECLEIVDEEFLMEAIKKAAR